MHAIAEHAMARAAGDRAAARAALEALFAGGPQDKPDSAAWIEASLLRARFDLEQLQGEPALQRLQRLRALLRERQLQGTLPLVEGERLTLCAWLAGQRGARAQANALVERAHKLYSVELGAEAPLMRAWAAVKAALPPAQPGAADIDCG